MKNILEGGPGSGRRPGGGGSNLQPRYRKGRSRAGAFSGNNSKYSKDWSTVLARGSVGRKKQASMIRGIRSATRIGRTMAGWKRSK